MPAEAVTAIIGENSNSTGWPHLSPSNVNPEKNCRRKLVFQRMLPVALDPRGAFAAKSGDFWHGFWGRNAAALEGWGHETWLPDQEGGDKDHPKVRMITRHGREIWQVEAFPGFWTRGRVDRQAPDWSEIVDHKTTKYPWTPKYKGKPRDYGERDAVDDWPIQLSLLAHMAEMLGRTQRVRDLWVWRTYLGSQLPEKTFRKFYVRRLEPAALWCRIEEYVLGAQALMKRVVKLTGEHTTFSDEYTEGVLKVAAVAPADGLDKDMFKGWLCREGCPFRDACFKIQGRLTF